MFCIFTAFAKTLFLIKIQQAQLFNTIKETYYFFILTREDF